jgi:glycosyltransferase involved in cell wall biosynthesis
MISRGTAPVAVLMISLNEGHNMEGVLQNLHGWAQEIFLVDSFSSDDTVEIALRYGVHVVQRKFQGFGDQWNFALSVLPITAPWTMKLDPDERLPDSLKESIMSEFQKDVHSAICFDRQLWFMGKPLPVRQEVLRIWRTGQCKFSDVSVNEHPIVVGNVIKVKGELKHLDSPDLDHWFDKQNHYTTAEANMLYFKAELSDKPIFWGTRLQRRMWLKSNFYLLPGRYFLFFLYHFIIIGTWRAGWVGYVWARLRSDVMRIIEYKRREIEITGRISLHRKSGPGIPDLRVRQYD